MMPTPFSAVQPTGSGASPVPYRLFFLACICLVLGTDKLQAQTVFRTVETDGQVTFSDKTAVTPASKATTLDNRPPAAVPSELLLPFELRQVVGKYPVTLYSTANCAPCDSGRELLRRRGVPFAEKTITSGQDSEALQRLNGKTSLPLLTLGNQHIDGYSASEWTQYLDAAGYPQRSKLPANYRAPQTAPLVAPEQASVPTPAASAATPAAPALPPVTDIKISPSNPAGIQF